MIINHNLMANNAIRNMNVNSGNASKSMQKLSSGLRINSAADDAAGLAISEKMRGQIRGLDQASANAQDGISMIQTAEGALNETTSMLQRMKELATQSANDTNVGDDRTQIQAEIDQLSSAINGIGNTTEFNKQSVLKGTNKAAVTTAQAVTTDQAGIAGVVAGTVSGLTTGKKSVVAAASSTSVQGNQAAATGTLKDFNIDTASEKGTNSTATLQNGLVFSSKTVDGAINNKTIQIKLTAGTTTNTFTNDGSNNYTITIGADNHYTTAGELYNAIVATTGYKDTTTTNPAATGITLAVPTNTAAAVDMTKIGDTQTLTGGKAETLGVASFSIDTPFKEAGDTITIGGKTFTAVNGSANAANGEFDISSQNATTQATSLHAALASVLGDKYTVADASGKITLTEKATTADGVDLTAPTTAGSGADDKLNITNASGKDLSTVTIEKSVVSASAAKATTDAVDSFTAISGVNGGELNGVKVTFSSITSAASADALTSTWNAGTKTLTVSGNINSAFAAATQTADMVTAIQTGLTSAGYNVGTMTSGANCATNTIANYNGKTITFGGGQGDGKAATTAIDTSYTVTAGAQGTELNGVNIKYDSLTESGSATALTSTWNDATRTLTVTGNITTASESAASIATATQAAIRSGLTSAGFSSTSVSGLTVAAGSTANVSNINNKTVTFANGETNISTADSMVVDQNNGELTIHLAGTTASKNTAAKIQAAVQKLGKVTTSAGEVDFSKYQFSASGNWDTKTVGEDIVKQTGTLVGGTEEVKGESTFSVTKMFAAGDVVEVAGQKFTAVASGADATKGQFNVGTDVNSQAAGIRAAINGNTTLAAKYTASGSGADVTLTENAATGTDLKTTDLSVKATGTQGKYEVNLGTTTAVDGAKFVIDGTEINVSSKEANVGYANGTAIKTASDAITQTNELATAINNNATLKDKYTATVDASTGNLVLTQKDLAASATAPDVKAVSSTKGEFTATLQIGANSDQSMTISISDMRANVLGVSGDGSSATVAAKNGKVASYMTNKTVTDGTSNTGIEYSLDISTDNGGTTANQKATAAISVLDDAINAVSAQRAKLGAYQNRLEHTINNLGTSSENLTSAESRIRDVDMAKEMSNYSKNNILSQAAQAMLAQANQQPQQVLQLLR